MTGIAPERPDRAIARVLAGGLQARCEVDPNVRVRGNQTFTRFADCDRVPAIGEHVIVFESEADIEGPAMCTGLDEGKQLIYLDVDWARLV